MIAVQLGASSRTAWLLLVSFGVSALIFGALWLAGGDWVAAGFCGLAVIGAARAGLLLVRRARMQSAAGVTARGRTFVRTPDAQLFVAFAHLSRGASVRDGVIVIAPGSAGFIPMTPWRPLWLVALKGLFVTRFRFVDLGVDRSAHADLDAALRELVQQREGTLVDDAWTYARGPRWLTPPGGGMILWIERAPPDAVLARWRPAPPPSLERYRWIRNRVLAAAAVIVVVFTLAGVAAWRGTGDVDYLVAALSYGVIIAGAAIAGVVLAGRRLAIEHPRARS
ncbi:MAG: hypothetical protein K1X88_19530 [Nannocystaceae bacterium]|nr:hypothetical protein [Nannocystaceae bacterium]